MSVQISYKKQILFFLLLLIIIFATIEVISRVYEFQYGACAFMNKQLIKELPPGLAKEICTDAISLRQELDFSYPPNQHYKRINVNEYGFRGPEISKEKPDHIIRIFVIGGSTVFGSGSTSDNTTIPGYLQNRFDNVDLPYKIEVINAGQEGSYSAVEINLVKDKLLEFEPDLLLVYDGVNDISRHLSSSSNYDSTTREISWLRQFLEKTSGETFIRTSIVLSGLIGQYVQDHPTFFKQHFNGEDVPENSKIWAHRWTSICEIGDEKGFKTVITLQPFLGTSNRTLTSDDQKIAELQDVWNMVHFYQYYTTAFNTLDDVCTKTIDLRNVFDNIDGPLFYDEAHVLDKGNSIVANRLFEEIYPLVKEIIEEKTS